MSRYQYDREGSGAKGQVGNPLSPNDPSDTGATGSPLYTNKFSQETAQRIRIGDPLSPVEAGDYSPLGKVYRKGQYAPTIDELASESLKQATDNSLINWELPLLNEDGRIDEKKLNTWNPNGDLSSYGATVSPEVPKHSSAIILSSFMDMGDWLSNLGIRHIFGGPETTNQPKGAFGDIIIQAETNGSNRKFSSSLRVFPHFYKYVGIPIRPAGVNKKTGVSVASYATYHAVGHIVFSKLTYDARLDSIGEFIHAANWQKNADVNVNSGSYMGYKNPSPWRRYEGGSFETELSKYSPLDDFAESFAMFYTNPTYLGKVSPGRYKVMQDILKEHGAL